MISECSIMLSGYNIMESATKMCDNIGCPLDLVSEAELAATSPTTTSTPAYLYMDALRNERLTSRLTSAQLDSLKNVIMESSPTALAAASDDLNIRISDNNNNNNNNNNISHYNSSNCSSNHDETSNTNSSRNSSNNTISDRNRLGRKGKLTGQQVSLTGQSPQSNINNNAYTSLLSSNPMSLHLASKYMKRERSSPSTNGDLQSTLARSSSSTPSSFHDSSPQQSKHSSPSIVNLPTHNLLNNMHQDATSVGRSSGLANLPTSTIISNSLLQQTSEPIARNYSDFMRNLAAKYNNSISNDYYSPKHNTTILESSLKQPANKRSPPEESIPESSITSALNAASIALANPLSRTVAHSPSQSLPDPVLSPIETITLKQSESSQPNSSNSTQPATDANFSPFITSFLSNLPFHQNCFSPLIDMSSTQALITLARVAKENEIQNMLRSVQNYKHPTETPGPSMTFTRDVNVALQQAMQLITPALLYSTQKHEPNSQHSSPSLAHSFDPTLNTNSSQSADETMSNKLVANKSNTNLMPLDLSSQPPLFKRFKADLTINESKNLSPIRSMTDRQVCASPSPPAPALTQNLKKPCVSDSRMSSPSTADAFTSSPAQVQNPTPNSATITATTNTTTTTFTPATATTNVCHAQSEEVNSWSVEDVCNFVGNIDICAEYIQHFRDQLIDGSGLPLLTEEHLTKTLGLKLGPALKLRSALAKKLGGLCPCVACMSQAQHVPPTPSNESLTAKPETQTQTTTPPIDKTAAAEDNHTNRSAGNMTNSSTANTSVSHLDDNDVTKISSDAATAMQCNEVFNSLHHLSNNSNNNASSHNVICASGNGGVSGEYISSGKSNTGNGSSSNCSSANLSQKHNDYSNSTVNSNHSNKNRKC